MGRKNAAEAAAERRRRTLGVPLIAIAGFFFCVYGIKNLIEDDLIYVAPYFFISAVSGFTILYVLLTGSLPLWLLEAALTLAGITATLVNDVLSYGMVGEWTLIIVVMDCMLLTDCRPCVYLLTCTTTVFFLIVKTSEEAQRFGLYDLFDNDSHTKPEAVGWGVGSSRMVVRLLVCVIDFYLTRRFAEGMRTEQKMMRESVALAEQIAEALVRFDLETAEDLLEGEASRVSSAFHELLQSLKLYRPYLPDAVVAVAAAADSETTEASAHNPVSGRPSAATASLVVGSAGVGVPGLLNTPGLYPVCPGLLPSTTDESGAVQRGVSPFTMPLSPEARRDKDSEGPAAANSPASSCNHRANSGSLNRMSLSGILREAHGLSQPNAITCSPSNVRARLAAALGFVNVFRTRRVSLLRCLPGRFYNTALQMKIFCTVVLGTVKGSEGTVIQVGADHIDVTWNSHVACHGHARQAALCALRCVDGFVNVGDSGVYFESACCMAVSTGNGVCGSGGNADQRAPVVGGTVQQTVVELARFARQIGIPAAADERCHELLRGVVTTKPVDCLRFEGEPPEDLLVYELLNPILVSAEYLSAFNALRNLEYARAKRLFTEHLQMVPDDAHARRLLTVSLYLRRAQSAELGKGSEVYFRRNVGWCDFEVSATKAGIRLPPTIPELLQSRSLDIDESSGPSPEGSRARLRQPLPDGLITASTERDDELLRRQLELQRRSQRSGTNPDQETEDEMLAREITDSHGCVWHRARSTLGRGAFGEVWLAMSGDGCLVALKSLSLPRVLCNDSPQEEPSPVVVQTDCLFPFMPVVAAEAPPTDNTQASRAVDELLREVGMMSSLRHDNIVSYIGSAVVHSHIVIVMEFLPGGSLHNLLMQFDQRLPLSSVQRYTRDMLRGLNFLHHRGVVHRDLKPHNVLLTTDGQCKLADFGAAAQLAARAQHTGSSPRAVVQGVVGTPHYMAPEGCRGAAVAASDIWGLGITVAELVTGQLPWHPSERGGVVFIQRLAKAHTDAEDAEPNEQKLEPSLRLLTHPLARGFVTSCLEWNPSLRQTPAALLSHPFVVG
eukprot:TRINITY_DN28116_c0_g1_i1.p1 TRINITY_DN28116_c0_g1~~TRINITY_DN28116_c0_g1_i1.p1  ORF type:complete len:1068 (+),score=253.14 TRINITY_DN28116_c0_g1_i1:89-3292(+)